MVTHALGEVLKVGVLAVGNPSERFEILCLGREEEMGPAG